MFVSPCIIIHSNKSTNQMHQSLRFIARRSQHARPRPTTLLPPCSNGKPEAATAVYKLLMMGKRMPETCWAVFKRQAINLRDWCIWVVDLFEWNVLSATTSTMCIHSCLLWETKNNGSDGLTKRNIPKTSSRLWKIRVCFTRLRTDGASTRLR